MSFFVGPIGFEGLDTKVTTIKTQYTKREIKINTPGILEKADTLNKRISQVKSPRRQLLKQNKIYNGVGKDKPDYNLSFRTKESVMRKGFRTSDSKETHFSGQEPLYKYGEKGSGFRCRYSMSQDFQKLRSECLKSRKLFEDPEFRPISTSVTRQSGFNAQIKWKRPKDLVDNPNFFVDAASRFDVVQGDLGNCWLLSAVANLTMNDEIFQHIVPDDQNFDSDYAGIFHFRIWQYGKWVDVVVDDYLPTYYDDLVFMHSRDKSEFWSALLEKAYAKLHGSYDALRGGTTDEAMEDFTGGVAEHFDLKDPPPDFYNILLKAYERGSLLSSSIDTEESGRPETETREGLVRGHAYSITKVKEVPLNYRILKEKVKLIRLRNPWGNEVEWNGAWSDKSAEWKKISSKERQTLELISEHDGEFWMAYSDFVRHFHSVGVCSLNPVSIEQTSMAKNKKRWNMSVFNGSWRRGTTAGGCRNHLDTFWKNPQYRITLTETDDDSADKCTLVVGLMQKHRRRQQKYGSEMLSIGFILYHLSDPTNVPKPLDRQYFEYNASIARSPAYQNSREMLCRFQLPAGTYCIVPSTYSPGEEAEFMLRIFSEKSAVFKEYDAEVGTCDIDKRVKKVSLGDDTFRNQTTEVFNRVVGQGGAFGWETLKEILDTCMKKEFSVRSGFSDDVCRSMLAMTDTDQSGLLDLNEFIILWADVIRWKNTFKLYDRDNSNSLDKDELKLALNSMGYTINSKLNSTLILRYARKNGKITFDDFILCAVKLKTMMDLWKVRSRRGRPAEFSLDDWLNATMYC